MLKDDYNVIRMKLWQEIAVAYTRSNNSTSSTLGTMWANTFLREFDKVFKKEIITENSD